METGFHHAITAGCVGKFACLATGTGLCTVSAAVIAFFHPFSAIIATDLQHIGGRGCSAGAGLAVAIRGRIGKSGFTGFSKTGFDDAVTAIPSFQETCRAAAVVILEIAVVTFFVAFTQVITTDMETGDRGVGGRRGRGRRGRRQ